MITFKKIDRDNYMECICLKVKESQQNFVADNARSLVEAQFEEGIYTRAIYADENRIVRIIVSIEDSRRERM